MSGFYVNIKLSNICILDFKIHWQGNICISGRFRAVLENSLKKNVSPSLRASLIFCVWTELYNFDTICDDPGSLSGWNAGLQMMLIILQRSPGSDPML